MWEPIRNLYITMVAKFKLEVDDVPFNKQFIFTPKSISMTHMKVMKGDEEKEMEQMMI